MIKGIAIGDISIDCQEPEKLRAFYAGDSLAGDEWDKRGWDKRTDIREFVLKISLDACIKM